MASSQLYKCSRCGHIIAASAPKCVGCGTPGPVARHPNNWRTAEPAEAVAAMLSGERDAAIVGGAKMAPVPPRTGSSSRPEVIVMAREKSSGLAAVLSFFWCGLGQIYTGQIAKGVTLMAVYPFLWFLGFAFSFGGCVSAASANTAADQGTAGGVLILGSIFLIGASALWIFGMVNAYRAAERENQRRIAQLRTGQAY